MNKKILLSFWLFINFILVNNAIAVVSATVDRSTLGLGQSLTLTIDAGKSNSEPDLSSLNNNFDVLGTSTSSQTSIINGSVSSQKNYVISLSPKNTGKQNIPAIKVGNDTTAPISINVTKQSISEQAVQKSQIFIDAKALSKPSYIGVPFIYSMKLYYSVGLTNVSMSDINITGATIQPLGKSAQYSENLKGVNYQVLEQKFQITPNQSGNITIPPIKIKGATMDNDIENSFFSMSRPKPFSIASKATIISIKPIPVGITQDQWFPAKQVTVSENQPNTSTTIKLGQPITRTITVAAIGVPDTSIPNLNLITPPNVNAYPDKTVANTSSNGNDLLATKVFKVAYIPTQAGTITFPETSIKWWDITSGTLKTAVIPAKTYTILNENGKPAASTT
ncbi:MAG TPA: BatD family protein, partial [Aquella sp.]|nr:BatD family protein [Aquella sp.]